MKNTRNYNTEEAINMLVAKQAVLAVIPGHLENMIQELAEAIAKYTPPNSKIGENIRRHCCEHSTSDKYFYTSIEGKGDVYKKISMYEEYPFYTFRVQASAQEVGSHDILFPFEIQLIVKPFTFLQQEEIELKWKYEALLDQYGIDDSNDDNLKNEKGIIHLMNSIDNLFVELQNLHVGCEENKNYIPEIKCKLSTLESELNWLENELEIKLEKLI